MILSGPASRRLLSAALAIILVTSITWLPAGVGNVGRKGGSGGGSGGGPGEVTLEFNPRVTEEVSIGEALADVAQNLVDTINSTEPNFTANLTTDPDDTNANSIEVKRSNGKDVNQLFVRANDDNINDVAVIFPTGRPVMHLFKPQSINGDGTYRLVVDRLQGADFDTTYDTTTAPNNTREGLFATITADLTTNGFVVANASGRLIINDAANRIRAGRVFATDSGACVTGIGLGAAAIPTLSQYAMFLLVLLMTGTAVWLLRRRRGATTA